MNVFLRHKYGITGSAYQLLRSYFKGKTQVIIFFNLMPHHSPSKVSRFLLLNDILKCMEAKHNFGLQQRYSIVLEPFLSIALDNIGALYYCTE